MRLSPALEVKLQQLAEVQGIDLNAAISVAIAVDWRRWFSDQERVG